MIDEAHPPAGVLQKQVHILLQALGLSLRREHILCLELLVHGQVDGVQVVAESVRPGAMVDLRDHQIVVLVHLPVQEEQLVGRGRAARLGRLATTRRQRLGGRRAPGAALMPAAHLASLSRRGTAQLPPPPAPPPPPARPHLPSLTSPPTSETPSTRDVTTSRGRASRTARHLMRSTPGPGYPGQLLELLQTEHRVGALLVPT